MNDVHLFSTPGHWHNNGLTAAHQGSARILRGLHHYQLRGPIAHFFRGFFRQIGFAGLVATAHDFLGDGRKGNHPDGPNHSLQEGIANGSFLFLIAVEGGHAFTVGIVVVKTIFVVILVVVVTTRVIIIIIIIIITGRSLLSSVQVRVANQLRQGQALFGRIHPSH